MLDENVRFEVKDFLKLKGFEVEYASKVTSNSKLTKDKRCILFIDTCSLSNYSKPTKK